MRRMTIGLAFLAGTTTPLFAEDPTFSTGRAETINPGLIDCGEGSRVSAVGKITAEDGSEWIVPADTNFTTAPKATDLYNECGGTTLADVKELDLDSVPIVDAGGDEVFTAYIFGDNYFEFYANGKLLGIDPVPFTPFNSNVIRFKADRPVTLAVLAVDWEENLGLGSELNRDRPFHTGDAGFAAHIKDADGNTVNITDQSWLAQTFYTSPLNERECLVIKGKTRDSSACRQDGDGVEDGTKFFAAHWAIPEGWTQADFDASSWPEAVIFSNQTVVVHNKPSFMNFVDIFDDPKADAQFIWSSNLVLDNLVLLRGTIE